MLLSMPHESADLEKREVPSLETGLVLEMRSQAPTISSMTNRGQVAPISSALKS